MSKKKPLPDPVLREISSPEALKALAPEQIPALCEGIREFLIENVQRTGGHLASNLGVVELTVAIHRVFSAPEDHILWDVGHQSYVHKMLTGRQEQFSTLRSPGGLSGFPTRGESVYDPFGAGHSSTAFSAALGFAEADRIEKRETFTVAVVGDGAFTGGMVHEAMNNCGKGLRMVVILNENEMSISRNIGKFAAAISRIRISRRYNSTKRRTRNVLTRIPLLGIPVSRLMAACKKKLKNGMFGSNLFEDLGFFYMGPIDGNNERLVENALREAKERKDSVILHIKTKKGKGYSPAESQPDVYHGITPAAERDSFHQKAGEILTQLAEEDSALCAITAAMGVGTGLSGFAAAHKDRYFDVGIAEEHAATFAAGLAAAGMKPYFAVYSTFLQRAYDNLLHDIALQELPVRLLVDRASLAVADGPTHHGVFDVAFLSHIPGIRILAPATYGSLEAMLRDSLGAKAPLAIRYPNAPQLPAAEEIFDPEGNFENYGVRADFSPDAPPERIIITYGRILSEALRAKEMLAEGGLSVGILLLESLAPYDECARRVAPYLRQDCRVVFLEEGMLYGGAGMLLRAEMAKWAPGLLSDSNYRILALQGGFPIQKAPGSPFRHFGISAEDAVLALTK